MEKKLAKPSSDKTERAAAHSSTVTDEMERKRELARKQAQDKVKARTLAKQQQLAELSEHPHKEGDSWISRLRSKLHINEHFES